MNTTINRGGLVLGILFAISVIVFALLSMFLGVGSALVSMLASLYVGYAATLKGIALGAIFAFIHGYITGALLVLLRNKLQ